MCTAQELGEKGEQFIFDLFEEAGREPVRASGSDVVLDGGEGLRIEVKAARLTRRSDAPGKRYTFSLYRARNGQVKTDARRSDLVCLLCYPTPAGGNGAPEPDVFAIPTARLGSRRQVALPENLVAYTGRWSWYAGFDRAVRELGENDG